MTPPGFSLRDTRHKSRRSAEPQVKATTECLQHQQLPGLDATVADGMVECNRHGRRRGIAMLLHRDDDALHRKSQLPGRRLDEPQIRLVRYQPIDCRRLKPMGEQCLFDDMGQFVHRGT